MPHFLQFFNLFPHSKDSSIILLCERSFLLSPFPFHLLHTRVRFNMVLCHLVSLERERGRFTFKLSRSIDADRIPDSIKTICVGTRCIKKHDAAKQTINLREILSSDRSDERHLLRLSLVRGTAETLENIVLPEAKPARRVRSWQ